MFEDVQTYRSLRKKYNLQMFRSGVDTFRGFEELEANAFKDGALDQKTKELIGIAVSITASCYGCVEYHVTHALELGATREQVAEAAAVALCLGGGTSHWPARYVFKVMEELEQQK